MEYEGVKILRAENTYQDDSVCNFVLIPAPDKELSPEQRADILGIPCSSRSTHRVTPARSKTTPPKEQQQEKSVPMKSITITLNLIGFLLSLLVIGRGISRNPDWLAFAGFVLAVTTALSFFMISFDEEDKAGSLPALFLKRRRLEEIQKIESIIARRKPPEDGILLEDEIKAENDTP